MKSRGMKHSNQVREFQITDEGLKLVDVYLGPDGILTGSARETQILLEETGHILHSNALNRKDRELLRKRKLLQDKINSLTTEFESTEEELNKVYVEEEIKREMMNKTRQKVSDLRSGTSQSSEKKENKKNKSE
jgi:circadian clock protein KaiC